jgi:hypothetical protein
MVIHPSHGTIRPHSRVVPLSNRTAVRVVAQLYDHERLDAMLNDAATEFCSAHVEITSAPGEDSVDFSGWSIREMKVRAPAPVPCAHSSSPAQQRIHCRRSTHAASGNPARPFTRAVPTYPACAPPMPSDVMLSLLQSLRHSGLVDTRTALAAHTCRCAGVTSA